MARVFSIMGLAATGLLALEVGALDGQWCSPDGRSLNIAGVTVRAPSGQIAAARYGKHALSFDDPEREDVEVWIEPSGADAVRVSTVRAIQQEPPAHDRWVRCERLSVLRPIDSLGSSPRDSRWGPKLPHLRSGL